MSALRPLLLSVLALCAGCKRSAPDDKPALRGTPLCKAAADPRSVLDFARRTYGDGLAISLSPTASRRSLVEAATKAGLQPFEQWTGRVVLVANRRVLDATAVSSDTTAWRDSVEPVVSEGRLPQSGPSLELVLASTDAAALGVSVGDPMRVYPMGEDEGLLDSVVATIVGLHGQRPGPLGDHSGATLFASRPLGGGATSVGLIAPRGHADDWLDPLRALPEASEFNVLSAEELQQPMMDWLRSITAQCKDAKAPAGKHQRPPPVAASCGELERWNEDNVELRAILGDEILPPFLNGRIAPVSREPIDLLGGYMFDTEGAHMLAVVERTAQGLARLGKFAVEGSLDNIAQRSIPALILSRPTAAAMGLGVGARIALATEATEPGQYTVTTHELVAVLDLPGRLDRLIGPFAWRLQTGSNPRLEARWYDEPGELRYETPDGLPLVGEGIDAQKATLTRLCNE